MKNSIKFLLSLSFDLSLDVRLGETDDYSRH